MDNTHSGHEEVDDCYSIDDSFEEDDNLYEPLVLIYSETNVITQEEKDRLIPNIPRDERIDNFLNEHWKYNVVDRKVAMMFEERVGRSMLHVNVGI